MRNILLPLVLLAACGQPAPTKPTPSQSPETAAQEPKLRPMPLQPLDITENQLDDAALVPVQRRDRRRMNVFQLNKAIKQVTGHDYPTLLDVKGSLGQPDYLAQVREVREPELFFQKFLSDAANRNCEQLLQDEIDAASQDRIFLTEIDISENDTTKVTSNLQYLLLQFHGQRYASDSDTISKWSSLFDSMQQASDNQTAWTGICVALIRHPDFYSY